MLFLSLFIACTYALTLDTSDTSSICSTAKTIAKGALNYYDASDSLGKFTSVAWWQSAVAFGSLLNYQHLCDDNEYEDLILEGLASQTGSDHNYEPSEMKDSIGNDDIGTWGLVTVHAAEIGFKEPDDTTWLELSQNVFDLLWSRWDEDTCNGGLRWQFDSSRDGYDYKALISNANLFQLGARLAKLTGNDTYTHASEEIYNWIYGAGLVNELENGSEVYDGFNTDTNCTDTIKVLWTYNYGTLIAGAGYLYSVTSDDTWEERAESLILGSQILYNNTVLYERACETYDICNSDQTIFKGVYSRFLGQTTTVISSLKSKVKDLMEPSAKGAARSCSGGSDGETCGQNWGLGYWDGKYSLGEQVSALETVISLLHL